MSNEPDRRGQLLLLHLQVAVPIEIHRLSQLPEDARWRQIEAWRADAVDQIASHGDALQFGGKRGDAARPFAATARALAALAYTPGGITFNGVHWCTDHAACLEAEQWAAEHSGELPLVVDEPQPTGRPVDTIAVAGGVL